MADYQTDHSQEPSEQEPKTFAGMAWLEWGIVAAILAIALVFGSLQGPDAHQPAAGSAAGTH